MITKLLEGIRRRGRGRSAPVAPTDLAVEYAPRADGQPDPGEVVWTWVPFEDDPSQGKDRPVVVLGRIGTQLAAVALTSKDHGPPDERVAVGTGAWDPQLRPSYAKIDRILTVDPHRVRREGSAFDRGQFDRLVQVVRRQHPDVVIIAPPRSGISTNSKR